MAKTEGAGPAKPKTPSPERVAAFQSGISAESRAAGYLIAKGYRILARRFRTPHGEIDIVARRRNLIAFIEVKARASLDEAAFAVTPRQQQRIIDAAQGWLAAHPDDPMALFKRAQVSVLLKEPDASARIELAKKRADAVTRPLVERERLFR